MINTMQAGNGSNEEPSAMSSSSQSYSHSDDYYNSLMPYNFHEKKTGKAKKAIQQTQKIKKQTSNN